MCGTEQHCAGTQPRRGRSPKAGGRGVALSELLGRFFFRITARQLTFARHDPWSFIENFNNGFNKLNTSGAHTKRKCPAMRGNEISQNRGQLEEGFRLWSQVRTWFMKNWDKWQEIETMDWCAENSIGERARESLDEVNQSE